MDSQPINVRTLVHHIEHLVLYSLLLWQLVLGVRWWIKTYFKYWKAPQEKPIYINGGGIQAPNVVGDNTTFDFQMKVTVTMLIYIWFIFVMRSPLYITIFSLLCIFSVYMIHIYQKTESKTSKKKLDKYKKRFLIILTLY